MAYSMQGGRAWHEIQAGGGGGRRHVGSVVLATLGWDCAICLAVTVHGRNPGF